MPTKIIPYGKQEVTDADIDSVISVLQSDFLTQGPVVPRFEDLIASRVGSKHGVATNSATSALHIACLALGVGAGDMVWTSANTFAASANCAVYCGANIDFVDIDPFTYNISIAALEEKLALAKKSGRLPKALIPVHFAGQPCEMDAIYDLSVEYGFKVIEDASHAIGAAYNGIPVGACNYSDITIFSFHPVKIITTGEGGIAVTNSNELRDKMMLLRSHGITSDPMKMRETTPSEIWNYEQIALGFNYRMTDIQAALGISQLDRLEKVVKKRHEIADFYNQELAHPSLCLPHQNANTFSSYHLYPILLRDPKCQRPAFTALRDLGINVNLHYIPVYRHPYYERLGFRIGYCPEAEKYFQREISLPIYPSLSQADQSFVIQSIKALLS